MPADLQTPVATRFTLRPRRAVYEASPKPFEGDLSALEDFDLAYRTLCAVLYNYVPTSGHPGGSISSGRIVQSLLLETMDYDFSSPYAEGADLVCYAGGHKAMGLYALWALRDEMVRIGRPDLLPEDLGHHRRVLADLLERRLGVLDRTDPPAELRRGGVVHPQRARRRGGNCSGITPSDQPARDVGEEGLALEVTPMDPRQQPDRAARSGIEHLDVLLDHLEGASEELVLVDDEVGLGSFGHLSLLP